MTWKQYGDAALNIFRRKYMGDTTTPEYAPDFTECVDHFAIHAGTEADPAACSGNIFEWWNLKWYSWI